MNVLTWNICTVQTNPFEWRGSTDDIYDQAALKLIENKTKIRTIFTKNDFDRLHVTVELYYLYKNYFKNMTIGEFIKSKPISDLRLFGGYDSDMKERPSVINCNTFNPKTWYDDWLNYHNTNNIQKLE